MSNRVSDMAVSLSRPPMPFCGQNMGVLPKFCPQNDTTGVRLEYDERTECFRAELDEWLVAHRPSRDEMIADPPRSTGHLPEWSRRWQHALFDAGLMVPGWPPELGGRNATPVEQLVYFEELARHRLPRTTN